MCDQDAKGQNKKPDHWALLALPGSLAIPRYQTSETVAAKPLEVYAALAKQRGLLAPQQKGLVAAHVGVKLFLTN